MKDLEPEQTIGNYRVIRRIGRGGMGSVYEVESLDLHERLALKTFTYDPKDDEDDVLKNKFLEEGKILARLRHPNIAHVYSLAYDQELELLYFVMDLVLSEDGLPYSVENASFEDLEEDTALAWFVDVCEALDYIHSQGIVHRDIKPGNLLVKTDGHVVLTDFGIAKVNAGKMKEEVNPAMTMRIDGNITVLGSNHYMAPEVESGGEVTPAADAYSLGVMMFEMLTGKWYDRVDDPWPLLDGRRYPWKHVLSMLLADDPADRPLGYAELAKRMPTWEGEDAPVVKVAPVAESVVKSAAGAGSKGWILPVAAILVVSLLFVGGGFFALHLLDSSEQPEVRTITEAPAVGPSAEVDDSLTEGALSEETVESETSPSSVAETKTEEGVLEPRREDGDSPVAETSEKKSEPEAGRESAAPAAPEAAQPKPEVVKIDYGPIPNARYSWFADGDKSAPKSVTFLLANGATFALCPYAPKDDYLMKDSWDMGTRAHKVTFTRPYWISKFCVEPSALRDWNPKGFDDCRGIESEVEGNYCVYRVLRYRDIRRFCEFLTDKYRSQLPPGYVFRLPTEAEWDRAIDVPGCQEAARKLKLSNWTDSVLYSSAWMHAEFAKARQRFDLDKFGRWETGPGRSGFLVGKGVLIGGRSMETPNGLSDVAFGCQPLLDCLPVGRELVYAEAERDPLHGADGLDFGDVSKAWVLGRQWLAGRAHLDAGGSFVFHLALGPDLVAEQAWRTRVVSENVAAKALPPAHYEWNPARIPPKLSRPREIDFKLSDGATMTFCAVPKGKFTMSNVSGQEAKSHKVELSYAFWMSKYCVTAEQRREYGRYDCEGACRALEKAFPKDPVYCAFNRREWEGYCRFLTERYREQIPDGYVFRLPTEAEYEWAFVGDEKRETRTVPSGRNSGDKKVMERFAKRLKKDGLALARNMDGRGFVQSENLCLGGIADPNVWGVYDLWMDGWTQWTEDLYDFDSFGSSSGSPERNVVYREREKDPFHWDGRAAKGGLLRGSRSGRALCGFDYMSRAHIVLAPDFVTARRKAEEEPCPNDDFGGRLIEDAVVSALSSECDPTRWCTEKRKTMLLSPDPALPGQNGRAFLTEDESAPWVEIELARRTTLAGAVIESFQDRALTARLTVWISEDGKRWREIAKADRTLGRYRFDFKGKNANRVKYVRVGRAPGQEAEPFALHKVRLYGRR